MKTVMKKIKSKAISLRM